MKVIYEFCPYEDRHELETFQNANLIAAFLDDVQNAWRQKIKYEGGWKSADFQEGYESAVDEYYKIKSESGVKI